MSLYDELGLKKPLKHRGQETLLNIIATAARLMGEAQDLLRPYNITESQLNVLMMLKFQTDDGTLNQTELGNMLFVKRSGVTGLVDRMEKAGLVQRSSDRSDRRVNLVSMTEEGRKLLARVEGVYFTRIEEIASALNGQEQERLSRMLERIRDNLDNTD